MDNATGRAACPHAADSIERMCSDHATITTAACFPAGMIVGDWRLTAFIGRGGNGEVYCAEHVTLGTPAAVKVLIRDDERAKVRFEREAKLLARMKSAAFPRFFAYGTINPPAQSCGAIKGTAYLAMELLEPGELPTGDRAIATFLLKVCEAVGELHALGYVHRDIKPGNILWRRVEDNAPYQAESRIGRAACPHAAASEEPVLSDLGLVKSLDSSNTQAFKPSNAPVTLGGVGTPGYGAPEQMERGEATEASDIHALGVLADQCFNGNPPQAWKRIIEHATSSIPAYRYRSVAALAHAIRWRNLWRNVGWTVLVMFLVGLFIDILIVVIVIWLW